MSPALSIVFAVLALIVAFVTLYVGIVIIGALWYGIRLLWGLGHAWFMYARGYPVGLRYRQARQQAHRLLLQRLVDSQALTEANPYLVKHLNECTHAELDAFCHRSRTASIPLWPIYRNRMAAFAEDLSQVAAYTPRNPGPRRCDYWYLRG